ncbi:MAG: PHP domain-containing protein [Treponema sp.]|jgi:hypothetical protein|nr:PHP domain-containing protein [Treponema sp.]
MKDHLETIKNPQVTMEERLESLRFLEAERSAIETGIAGESVPRAAREINNHIHTVYSFSPYTPSMAALRGRDAGLSAAGSVDHDSAAAAEEMLAACAIVGIGGCVGFEVRASFATGPGAGAFAGRKLNNPDSEGIAYMTVQGIPRQEQGRVRDFLKPIQEERIKRTAAMADAAGQILREAGLEPIDFDRDVYGKSMAARGGEITERHLLAAVAEKFIKKYGKGREITRGLREHLGLEAPPKIASLLADAGNPHYLYDLLGILKPGFLPRIFIQPGEAEAIPVEQVTAFANGIGAIPAYAYLGDVGESPTGDKKAERFEDAYLDELFEALVRLGYRAVTYMPPRNTEAQLRRVQRLCAEWGLMEISGVDINSSRQSFNCPEVLLPPFRHLIDTTWALIAHERLSSEDKRYGLFSPENPLKNAPLGERLAVYARAGLDLDLKHPEESIFRIKKAISEGR